MNGNKINGKLIQIVLLIAIALYIIADKALAPLVANATGKNQARIMTVSDQTAIKIDKLAETVSAQSEAIGGLKISVERLERKIDAHITK